MLLTALSGSTPSSREAVSIVTKVLAEDREKRAPGQTVEMRHSLHDPPCPLVAPAEARLREVQNEARASSTVSGSIDRAGGS